MRMRKYGQTWDVQLEDDGTLDTVISVCPIKGNHDREEFRYTLEGNERTADGVLKMSAFRMLAVDAIDKYDEELQS